MEKYIPFTEEEREKAREIDIAEMLRSQGQHLKKSGSELEWLDGGQKVTIRGNVWFHQYEQIGGDTVDFVEKFYGKTYPEAVDFLLNGFPGILCTSSVEKSYERKEFILPHKNDNMHRVKAYLVNERGIDEKILSAFEYRNMIYESYPYHNAVFVGYDGEGNPRHACKRGTGKRKIYKGNAPGSRPEFSFHWTGGNKILYAFEAPIDMLSYISMHRENWRDSNYVACCGVGEKAVMQMLKDTPDIVSVMICFDSDAPGQKASHQLYDKLLNMGKTAEILVPIHKDWNEDLLLSGEAEH